jgi:phage terminase large subunit
MTPNDLLGAETIWRWRASPRLMALELFGFVPDHWQSEALDAFPHSPRIAMKSCKGPGKSCILAILAWNFLLCYPQSIAGATSINAPNLYSNLWVELARWKAKAKGNLLEGMFETTTKEIRHREYPDTWKLQARTWRSDATPEQIGNALAGLHADYVAWFMDETGDYPDAIMPTVEAIFAGNPKVARIVQAGNPTRLSGPLYMAVSKARHLWQVIDITADPDDPRRTPRVSVEHAREQIGLYGRDNPWVLVNIFGQFPPSSLNALIGPEEVRAAMERYWGPFEIGSAPKVLGVDVARFGDDRSVVCSRQGIQVFPFKIYRNLDSIQGASEVTRAWSAFDADACFVDDSGGFGSGWLDQLRALGRSAVPVSFAGKAQEHGRFKNKRAEMYFAACDWIRAGGALPESEELVEEISAITYTFAKGSSQLILEDKDQIKARLGRSPDSADALALTFAESVMPRRRELRRRREPEEEWNPFRETGADRFSSCTDDYNPFQERW